MFNAGDIIPATGYNTGGEGVGYHDSETKNRGDDSFRSGDGVDIQKGGSTGHITAYALPGEWLKYDVNIPSDGWYSIQASVSNISEGGSFHIEFNGKNVTGAIRVPETGGWFSFQSVGYGPFELAAGTAVMKLCMDTSAVKGGIGNFDWLKIVSSFSIPEKYASEPIARDAYVAGHMDAINPPPVVQPLLPPTPPVVADPVNYAKWQNWLTVTPPPPEGYVPDGTDLTPLLVAATAGQKIVCVPKTGNYKLSATTRIQAGVCLYLNGSSLHCEVSPDSASNMIGLGEGIVIDGAHITKGDVLLRSYKGNCTISQCYSEDYAPFQNADGKVDWKGVAVNFAFGEDESAGLKLDSNWIGLTGSVSFFTTADHEINKCYFVGSIGEYDYRTEKSGGNHKCAKALVRNSIFRYQNKLGKGSAIGLRMGDGIEFDDCWVESNVRAGQVAKAPPWITSDSTCNAGTVFNRVKFFNVWEDAPAVVVDQGVQLQISSCEVFGNKNAPMIQVDTASTVKSSGHIMHLPVGAVFRVFAESAKGTFSDTGSTSDNNMAPPVLPAIPF